MADSNVFSLQIAQFAKKAGDNADAVVRKVVLDVGARIVQRSPVDTGRFRANWQHSVDSYPTDTTEAVDPEGATTLEAIAADVAEQPAGGHVHYLTNSLPYVIPLENGHSKQAPSGVVAVTVVEYQGFVDAAVAGLPK